MDNKINVGIYVRVSTEDQKEHGYSIQQQIDILSTLANSNNWNIYNIYNDAGISGKNTEDRPMLKELIEDVKNNRISKILITKLDRLSRNVVDTETLLNIFNSFNCELLDSSGKAIESDNPSGWLFTIMQSVFGQYERKAIISRVKDGFAGKVKQGKSLCSSTPPYGYDRECGSFVLSINEYEASIVKRIYIMYIEGYTFSEISKVLNAEKVMTKLNGKVIRKKNNDGSSKEVLIISRWMPKTIRLILSNPTYIGKVRYHVNKPDYKEYDGLHEPIINIKEYNDVQEKIIKRKKSYRTKRPKEDVYYCGTLRCGICNEKMTTQRTIKNKKSGDSVVHFGYKCVNREKGICIARGISHKKVEEAFLKYIDKIGELTEIDDLDIIKMDNSKTEEVDNIRKCIGVLRNKKEKIMSLFMDDQITNEQIQYMTKELDEREKILKQRLSRLQLDLEKMPKITTNNISTNIKDHWQYLTNRERLDFLNQFIEYISIVNENKVKGKTQIIEVKFYE